MRELTDARHSGKDLKQIVAALNSVFAAGQLLPDAMLIGSSKSWTASFTGVCGVGNFCAAGNGGPCGGVDRQSTL
jgi:hypothetical protein